MTKEEILAMKPGLELNIKIAEEIIGHQVVEDDIFGHVERWTDEENESVWDALHPYSEDLAVAEVVVKKMIELGHDDAIYWADFGCGIYTEPEAICKAALLALLA
ncbi:hypothetical protein ACFLW2_04275 [Chloroflexota bacterium]